MTQEDQTLMDLLGGDDGGDEKSGRNLDKKTKPSAPDRTSPTASAPSATAPSPAKKPDLKKPESQEQANVATGKKTQGAKVEPKRFKAGTVVSYAGHSRTIGEDGFGEEVPESGLTEEEVFRLLSEDFPELTKSRAELVHDVKENRVIPVLKGHRKGGSQNALTVHRKPPPLPVDDWPPVTHLLGADGVVYAARTTQAAVFIARVPSSRRVKEGFDLRVPKAPASLLAEAVTFFKRDPNNEALANVVYDRGSYALETPEQETNAVAVQAPAMPETDNRFVFVQLHSHARMRAFFSGQDTRDELRTGFYGVLGPMDERRPEALFRFSCGGVFVGVNPYRLFEEARPGELEEAVEPLFQHFEPHDAP